MSDLRNRVAAILFMRDDEAQIGWARDYAELPAEIKELWCFEADAVIAGLELHEEVVYSDDIRKRFRWVTAWEEDWNDGNV